MLSVGIDTHLEMHQVEVLNEEEKVMRRGQTGNNRKGFEELLEKLSTIERSNDQHFVGVYINPTGCYHVPLSHFLQQKGYKVIAVDPRRSAAGRKMENLGRVKSDRMLTSLPRCPGGTESSGRRVHTRGSHSLN
ncbi:MAG: transposase [Candidatus Thermoplasmatota archaeon]|nr:transposase [Candidatus Thermoplasmatota archaeon]MCL5253863.1 transposase [Candidatus Thermoplasmatota archaeon]